MREMKDSGVEWIGQIPKDWDSIRTKNKFKYSKEIVGSQVDDYERLSLTLNGVLKRSKGDSNGLQPEKFNGYQILRVKDLVFKLIDLENVATSRVGLSEFNGLVSPAYIVLSNSEESSFGYYYFISLWQREIFNRLGGDGVRSALNKSDLLEIPYLNVPENERREIVQFLDRKLSLINSIIARTKSTIADYKLLKQSIITEAVTKGLDKQVEMKDSRVEWIGDIPNHWEVTKLRYLGALQNGISKSSESFGSGTPFVSYSDIYKNYEVPSHVDGLVEATENDRISYSVLKGDVFFTRTSETIEEIGLTSTCLHTIPEATFAGFLIRFRPLTEKSMHNMYSKYFFRSEIHRKYFVKEMNLVTRASLSQGLLKNLIVLLPPFIEQQQIGEYLELKCGEIDLLINKKTEIIKEIEKYKKSLIYECVTGKIEVE